MDRLARRLAAGVLAMALSLVDAATAQAVTKCSAKVDGKTGVVLVSASGVAGPLRWGERPGAESASFANEVDCVDGTRASKCTLGATAPSPAREAVTPPDLCTIYVFDGAARCAAYLKGCTPGTRFAAGHDTSGALAGSGGRECVLGEAWLVAGTRAGGATPADGRIIAIGSNTPLFSLIGNAYGGSIATNTFALPDLRRAAPDGLTYVICTQGIFPGS